jgi:hypothetical protein
MLVADAKQERKKKQYSTRYRPGEGTWNHQNDEDFRFQDDTTASEEESSG